MIPEFKLQYNTNIKTNTWYLFQKNVLSTEIGFHFLINILHTVLEKVAEHKLTHL